MRKSAVYSFFLLTAYLCAVPAAFAQNETGKPSSAGSIGLDEAVSLAMEKGDDIVALRETLASARGQFVSAEAKNKISFSGTAGYGLVDTVGDTNVKTSWSKSAGLYNNPTVGVVMTSPLTKTSLSATQSIPTPDLNVNQTTVISGSFAGTVWDGYPGGQTKAAVEKSYLALQGKELTFQSGKSALIAKVKQAYATMLGAQRTLALRIEQTRKQKNLYEQVAAIYKIRQASEVDLKTAQINAATAELDQETARHDLAVARRKLAVLIGMPNAGDFAVKETEDPKLPAANVEEAIAAALEKRTDLAQLRLSLRSSGIDLALAKGSAQPSVGISGTVNSAFSWARDPVSVTTVTAGVSVVFPVTDAGASKGAIDSNAALMTAYSAQERTLAAGIETDIRDAFWTAEIQKKKAALAENAMSLAEDQFLLTKTQNTFGTATLQDVLTASITAANAGAAYAAARTAYLLSVTTLELAMGL